VEYFKPLPGHPSQNASPPAQPRSAFSRGLYYTDIPCNAGNHNPPSCVNPLPTDYPCSTVRVRIQVHGPLENRDFYPYNTGIACSPLGYVPRPLQTDQGEASLRKIVLQPLIRGRRPHQHLEEDVATILGFSAPLYEVRQLSWRPAQVDRRAP